jgi:arylsulfatase A-like enzyme
MQLHYRRVLAILTSLLPGLPSDIPTLPALMSELGGYSTAMTGKWHLGHAQHKMTPIGRGFDYFTGRCTYRGARI